MPPRFLSPDRRNMRSLGLDAREKLSRLMTEPDLDDARQHGGEGVHAAACCQPSSLLAYCEPPVRFRR